MTQLWHHEITYADPVRLFQQFSGDVGAVLLHSAKKTPKLGRYSYFAVDPFALLRIESHANVDAFSVFQAKMDQYSFDPIPDLPPFQGGAMGFLSYELVQQLEKVSPAKIDDQQFPQLLLGFYDLVVSFDHEQQRAWVVSSGLPQENDHKRVERAQVRGEWLLGELAAPLPMVDYGDVVLDQDDICANMSRAEYLPLIQKTIDYIFAGDIFEANIAQRFCAKLPEGLTAWHLFTRSCLMNAATFASFVNFGDLQLASASPERFIKVENDRVECRPIKGTRPRSRDLIEDQRLAQELCASEKDRAENIMIVDLMRNDISRVCLDDSVQVTQLCGLESYATVHHLVSVVEGELTRKASIVDLLRATFPGGSITGAPKIRAIEIIAELEPHVRGPYCGNVLCVGFDGFMDSSIIIRTFALRNNQITFHAGGAIVADSNPAQEYQESLDKAAALRLALTQTVSQSQREKIL